MGAKRSRKERESGEPRKLRGKEYEKALEKLQTDLC